MKVQIRLDTVTDIGNFVIAVTTATDKNEKVYVTNGDRLCIDGKSFLGLIHAREFDELYCECEKDIYAKIMPFAVSDGLEAVGE